MEAVAAFARNDVGRAVFYAEDDRFVVDRETTTEHFQVIEAPAGDRWRRGDEE
jgi:hypothetical protein